MTVSKTGQSSLQPTTGSQPAITDKNVERTGPRQQRGAAAVGDSVVRVGGSTGTTLAGVRPPSPQRTSGATMGGGGGVGAPAGLDFGTSEIAVPAEIARGSETKNYESTGAVATGLTGRTDFRGRPGEVDLAGATVLVGTSGEKHENGIRFTARNRQGYQALRSSFVDYATTHDIILDNGRHVRMTRAEAEAFIDRVSARRPDGPPLSAEAIAWLRQDFARRSAVFAEQQAALALALAAPIASQYEAPVVAGAVDASTTGAAARIADGRALQRDASANLSDAMRENNQRRDADDLRRPKNS